MEVQNLCRRLRRKGGPFFSLTVDESVWSPGQSEPISQALLENEVVDAIELDTQLFAQQLSSITQENGSDEEARNSHDRAFSNLLLYLETNPTLGRVRVSNGDNRSLVGNAAYLSTTNMILAFLAKNSRIISFTSKGWMPCEPLGHYLATAPLLRYVNLALGHFEEIEEINTILNGPALNPTITDLNISNESGQDSLWLSNLPLLDHPTLRYLHISEYHHPRIENPCIEMEISPTDGRSPKRITIKEGESEMSLGVALFLNHLRGHTKVDAIILRRRSLESGVIALHLCDATHIEKLVLRECRVTKGIWIKLRGALKANATVTKLELSECKFDNEATADFVHSVGSVVSSVCFPFNLGSVFGELTLLNMYKTLLFARDNPLKNLEILHNRDANRFFFGSFGENQASDIRVESLRLHFNFFNSEGGALEKCLPGFTKLRTLNFDTCRASGSLSRLLEGLRLNGSLWEFGEGDTRLWSKTEKRKVTAFFQRNRRVPELLANAESDKTLMFLVPCLFRLAQQSPRMAPNKVLLGLIALNSIKGPASESSKGSTGDNKRLRADHV
jgi:hypothetical protein